MESYIPITFLNDFIFCPYSIYLHNVYGNHNEENYHTTFQQNGLNSHQTIDKNYYSTRKNDLTSLEVYSKKYKLAGKIDLYKKDSKTLIERKRQIKQIYPGYIYQLYAQYFCMLEMNYQIDKLAFYCFTSNTVYPLKLPEKPEIQLFENYLASFNNFDITKFQQTNLAKCKNCIYNNLCDKTTYYA